MFGLLGPNGAGKSTLMRILATLQEADAGAVTLDDIDVLREKDRVRQTLGYLPQEFGLYPKLSAEALLEHFAVLKGITARGERRAVVDALLEQTNLSRSRKRKLGEYSGGMRQRFGIAIALLANPRLIIVDEPTAGLDPAERVRFLNLLSELGENSIVILSTHIVEDVSELCSRMAIIKQGEIILEQVRYQAPPYSNSPVVLEHLRAETPDSLRYVLQDMFETITLYENRAVRATASAQADGSFLVRLEIEAGKVRADSLGNETDVPMHDWIDVGVFGAKTADDADEGKELYLARHRVAQGASTLEIRVSEKPERAGIDPYHKLIDRHTNDNVVTVREGG
jgi:ABC-type multidrug transport system ATPase subunit